jgi:SAM-dependent methyltransferase
LSGVRQRAKERKQEKFTALLHHLTVDRLRESYFALQRRATPGIDGETWQQYGTGLEGRMVDLHSRVHRGAYRAKPSRKVYIPKADGRQRPLGIAALEDKIVQQAIRIYNGWVPDELIDVKKLIEQLSIEELNDSAEVYWKLHAESEKLHAKPYTLDEVQHLLVQVAHLVGQLQVYHGMTVLEFGAGSCWAGRILNQMGLRVISCDVSATALALGQQLSLKWPPAGKQPPHTFLHLNGRRFDLPDNSIDRIFCLDAFHHVPSQEDLLREMARVLKPGGIAGFSEPGPNHSKHPQSQFEMRNYAVIENDVRLPEVYKYARCYGFTELKVAVAPIHPVLVPFEELNGFFQQPQPFISAVRDRVENYPIFFLYKGTPEIHDSRSPSGLTAAIEPAVSEISVRTVESLMVALRITNNSHKTWLPSGTAPGSVNIGGFVHGPLSDGLALQNRQYRGSVSEMEVTPGQSVQSLLELGRLPVGLYKLEIDLVSERVCWFQSNGTPAIEITIRVVP